MASRKIILFDLPSRGGHSWSLNAFKGRAVLNFKALDYDTRWVEYPDIEPLFKSLSIPANDPKVNPRAAYSIPAVRLEDGRHIMDSLAIAHAIEQMHPTPSLYLKGNDYAERTQNIVLEIMGGLTPIAIPRVSEKLLNPASVEYFNRTRKARFGMELTELAKSDQAGETAWKNAEPGFEKLSALLRENRDKGPYIQGAEPSFADLIVAGFWKMLGYLDEGDLFGRAMKQDPESMYESHYQHCSKWLDRVDH